MTSERSDLTLNDIFNECEYTMVRVFSTQRVTLVCLTDTEGAVHSFEVWVSLSDEGTVMRLTHHRDAISAIGYAIIQVNDLIVNINDGVSSLTKMSQDTLAHLENLTKDLVVCLGVVTHL